MKAKYIFGIVIIVGFIIWAGVSFNKTLTPYVSIAEAKESTTIVQVKGKRLDNGSFNTDKNLFTFHLIDESGDQVTVVYDGAKPGNFEQATEVVCVGRYENGIFQAKEILVKCPSKYNEEKSQV
ncbi:MAG: cytochrome c maturation protein CcmE [Calditrichales bacterium]|nr:MAG: cytochrome c maturation protein CcmE [Calditrichales bacterium]